MTPLHMLLQLSGLSQREAATMLNVSASSIDKMTRGARSTPPGLIAEMGALIKQQEDAADRAVALINASPAAEVEIGYPSDDYEASTLGMPTVSAWSQMAARVIARAAKPVRLVPRGSTLETAGAIQARENPTPRSP